MARIAQARRVLVKALDAVNAQVARGGLDDLTFLNIDGPSLTQVERDAVEKYVRAQFKTWAETWVQPYIAQAIDIIDGKEVPWSEDLSR